MSERDVAGTVALINFIVNMALFAVALWLIKATCKEAVQEALKEEKLIVMEETENED